MNYLREEGAIVVLLQLVCIGLSCKAGARLLEENLCVRAFGNSLCVAVTMILLVHPSGGECSSKRPSTSDCAGLSWANASADLGEKRGLQLVSEQEPALKKCAVTQSEDCCVLGNFQL